MKKLLGALLALASSVCVAAGPTVDPALPRYQPRAFQAAPATAVRIAAAMRATPDVRVLPIAPADGAQPVAPTAQSLMAGRYPLDRYLLIYAKPPLSPFAREFLRLVLSREGQQAVADTPQGYLPLSSAEAARELAKLER